MFDSSNYEKLLSDFTLKVATYSYNKKVKELNPDYETEKETLSKAQSVIDRYELWQNKGKAQLTNEETELTEKLNACA